jgi:hypothetical protein
LLGDPRQPRGFPEWERNLINDTIYREGNGSDVVFDVRYRPSRHIPWLAPVIRLLGGPAATARFLGRDRSTIHRWATDQRPIPAYAAEMLARKASEAQSELTLVIAELRKRQRQGELRAAQGTARRRAALRRGRAGSCVAVDEAARAARPPVIRNIDDPRRWREAEGLD